MRGKQNAELAQKKLEEAQSSSDRHEGWRYFLEKSELKAGTNPSEATHLRQTDLEDRESKAQQETTSIIRPASDTER